MNGVQSLQRGWVCVFQLEKHCWKASIPHHWVAFLHLCNIQGYTTAPCTVPLKLCDGASITGLNQQTIVMDLYNSPLL